LVLSLGGTVVASTTVDSVVVLLGIVVVVVDVLVVELVDDDVVVDGFVVVTPGPSTVKGALLFWPLGLVALIVAAPRSEQFVALADEHWGGTLTTEEPGPPPLANAIVLTREPWMKSTAMHVWRVAVL
jgi:hypothetical protein